MDAELKLLVERLTSQLLAGPPAESAEAVAGQLLAIQGQDPRGARLAVRARTVGVSAADIDHALTESRSLLITWLCRGTLHLVRVEDYPWLQALTTPPLQVGNARRLAQEGVSADAAERGVDAIERSLAEEGPLTRAELRERIAAAGVHTEGQALVHLLLLASLRGLVVRGPMIGSEHAFVLVREWLDEPAPVQRDRALAELARRYLVGHGPADDRDLARWAGLPLRDARAGLAAIASELVERPDGLVDLRSRAPAAQLPPPRLLGAFDPVLLGWRSRDAIVQEHKRLVTDNGLFRPFALVRGRAAGIWSVRGGKVTLAPFGRIAGPDAAALEADARDVERFLAGAVEGP
ncbi:MAG: winged helix DNA-binding domain-containing protein [Actinomycetota bacterium]|nr:winged helix DNA-binding domain-containing protein [Actinomycetota bacterium]